MQVGSVDPAAGIGRKTSRRCRRVKSRIEKRASTETESGRAPAHWSAVGLKPAAGS